MVLKLWHLFSNHLVLRNYLWNILFKSSSFAELQYLWHLVQTLLVLWNYFLKNVVFSHAKLSVNFCIFNPLISTLLVLQNSLWNILFQTFSFFKTICETFCFKPSRFFFFKTICETFCFKPSCSSKQFVKHFVSNFLVLQNYL